jgi:hypothetical protein
MVVRRNEERLIPHEYQCRHESFQLMHFLRRVKQGNGPYGKNPDVGKESRAIDSRALNISFHSPWCFPEQLEGDSGFCNFDVLKKDVPAESSTCRPV